jgi:hypothetical protein
MDYGNKLSEQDIISFNEALEYERKMSPLLEEFN